MSTTFAVKVPSISDYEDGEVNVAYRSKGVRWLDPLAQLLPDDTKVIAVDNSAQGIYTIGDIKKVMSVKNDYDAGVKDGYEKGYKEAIKTFAEQNKFLVEKLTK